jgi:two-component system response regulator NreC
LVEDHSVVREGLRLLLESQPDIRVVGEAVTGQQAIVLAQQLRPDVAVMDIAMPDLDGIQATAHIRQLSPQTRVLILTMHASDAYFFRAVDAGASGYILKRAASEELIHAVHAVARDEAFFYPEMARKLLDGYRAQARSGPPLGPPGYQELSEQERKILFLLVQGRSTSQIAAELVISASTVQTHRAHILEKLGLDNTIDLVRYAIRHGLIEP